MLSRPHAKMKVGRGNKMQIKKMNQKGFSLIELMIVVGIIGVLATMAVPKFNAFQAKAKQTEAKTTLNHIYTLQEAYFIDYSSYAGNGAAAGEYGANLANANQVSAGCSDPATNAPWAPSIGFSLSPCDAQKPIYSYNVAAAGGTYTATAQTGTSANNKLFPGCSTADIWQMTYDHKLDNTQKGIIDCN